MVTSKDLEIPDFIFSVTFRRFKDTLCKVVERPFKVGRPNWTFLDFSHEPNPIEGPNTRGIGRGKRGPLVYTRVFSGKFLEQKLCRKVKAVEVFWL